MVENLSAIVAMGRDGAIGRGGDMPWHLPEDLKHFKELTSGHPVIMGRRTWESLPKRPLQGRLNIVVTRDAAYDAPGAATASSLAQALDLCPADSRPFVIGGASLYREAAPLCSRFYITWIETETPDADTWFPDVNLNACRIVEDSGTMESKRGLLYRFVTYESGNNQ